MKKRTQNEFHLEKLTPTSSADIGIYEAALDAAFADNDIRNIALSGAYGSGKSSIMQSYLIKNPEKRFLQISLANFDPEVKLDNYPIEGKIVNQLIQQINPRKIPQKGFKIKHLFGKAKIITWTILISMLAASICYLKFQEKISSILSNSGFKQANWIYGLLTPEQISQLCIVIIMLCSITCISLIVRLFGRELSIHKLKFLSAELEIFEGNDKNEHSIFDTEIQEIKYLIEQSKADAIIFEDIDRFNSPSVLERIREINIILNCRYKNSNKGRPIKFIYLIKDELLKAMDRVKFFDMIIPVVPILSGSNSYDMLIEILKKDKTLYEKLNPSFMQDLSLYVTDYRLLKNIVNELKIYASRIDKTELDYNKLLAIITYKSLFPNDFGKLQEGHGYVFNLFEQKSSLISHIVHEYTEELTELKSNIEQMKNEQLSDRLELATAIYVRNHFSENDVTFARHATKEDLLAAIMEDFSDTDKDEYEKREESLKFKENGKVNRIQQLEKYLSLISSYPLMKLLKQCDSESYFNSICERDYSGKETNKEFKKVKANPYYPLIKFLIRNGYIDETYSSYMTYFYGVSLSQKDMIFLRSITDRKGKGPEYRLDSPEAVLNRCSAYYFEIHEILNYDLLAYLIQKKEKYSAYLDQFISLLESEENLEFVSGYRNSAHEFLPLVEAINIRWPSCFHNLVLRSDVISEDLLYEFSLDTLINADDKTLTAVNIDNCLTKYISSQSYYSNINVHKLETISHAFEILEVKFKSLDEKKFDAKLLRSVYEKSMYVLSFQNICMFMRLYLEIENVQAIQHSNYSILQNVAESPLYKYVRANMSKYLRIYLDNCDNVIEDTELAILEILNTESLDESLKESYIKLLRENQINDISKVESSELQTLLFAQCVAICNEKNIFEYFITCGKKLNKTLIDFLEKAEDLVALNFKPYKRDDTTDVVEEMTKAFLMDEMLSEEKYWQMISVLPRFEELDISTITESRMQILIKQQYIKFTDENLETLRNTFPALVPDYIELNFDSYIGSEEIPEDIMLDILASTKLSNEKKIRALDHGGEYQISIVGKSYPYEILPAIMSRYLCDDDLEDMFSHYEDYPENTREYIYRRAYELLMDEQIKPYLTILSKQLIDALIADKEIEQTTRIALLDLIAEQLNASETKAYITQIDSIFYTLFYKNKNKRIPLSDGNTKLLEIAQRRKVIRKYTKIKGKDLYQVSL